METHFAGDHRVVGFAVSAVIAAGGQDTVQQGSADDNEIQLVTVTRSGVPPGHSVALWCERRQGTLWCERVSFLHTPKDC